MGWKQDRELLPGIAKIVRWFPIAWIGVRFADLAWKGRLGLLFAADRYSALFWIETGLAAWGAAILFTEEGRFDPGKRFWAALLLIFSGALYRFDTYILALRPLGHWSYFPSLGEITIALSLWSMAFCVFVLLSRLFPVIAAPAKVQP
jgi:Ni/Fe-hydrogenase subunit HybB-like protein